MSRDEGRFTSRLPQATSPVLGKPDDPRMSTTPSVSRTETTRDRPRDPAEGMPSLGVFYQNWRPTPLGKLVSRFSAWLSGLGLTPPVLLNVLVQGRNSGRLRSTVLVPATYNGDRYFVSMLGEGSDWVQNVRAAGGQAFIKRGRTHPIMLTEIEPADRAPILKAYCQV